MRHRYLSMALILAMAIEGGLQAASPQDSQASRQQEILLQKAIQKETVDGDLKAAIEQYKKIIAARGADRAVAARALLQLGGCYEKLGDAEARKAFEQLLKDYSDQTEVAAQARARLAALTASTGPAVAAPGPTVRKLLAHQSKMPCRLGQVSPDGKYFSCAGEDNLYIREVESGIGRKLTAYDEGANNPDHMDTYTAWSADGMWLAYVRSGPSKVDVGVVAIENPKPRIIYTLNGIPNIPWSTVIWNVRWLLDGKTILAQAYEDERPDRVLFISVEKGLIKSVPLALYDLGLSPDGKYLANKGCYESAKSSCITVHRVENFQLISTLPDPKLNSILGWSPQGDSLIFSSERGGPSALWRQRLNEGKPEGEAEVLKSGIGEFFPLGIDRSGRIYYRTITRRDDVYVVEVNSAEVKSAEAPRRIGQSGLGYDRSPAWSPDGKWLAYICPQSAAERFFTKTLCLWSVDSAQMRQVVLETSLSGRPITWSLDSKYLFSVAGFPTSDFLKVNTETGETVKLETGERSVIFALAPDISVVYKSLGGFNMPNQRILARDMKTGQEKEIYHSAEASRFSLRTISPDGRWLAFARLVFKEGGAQDYTDLLMVPAGGGAVREILKLPEGAGGIHPTGWSADSKFLYYSVYQQKNKMWQVAVDGGEPTEARLPLGEFSNKFDELSFSPDGKRVTFMATSSGPWEVWVMENFLPPAKSPGRPR